jgi:hypothetical protein
LENPKNEQTKRDTIKNLSFPIEFNERKNDSKSNKTESFKFEKKDEVLEFLRT